MIFISCFPIDLSQGVEHIIDQVNASKSDVSIKEETNQILQESEEICNRFDTENHQVRSEYEDVRKETVRALYDLQDTTHMDLEIMREELGNKKISRREINIIKGEALELKELSKRVEDPFTDIAHISFSQMTQEQAMQIYNYLLLETNFDHFSGNRDGNNPDNLQSIGSHGDVRFAQRKLIENIYGFDPKDSNFSQLGIRGELPEGMRGYFVRPQSEIESVIKSGEQLDQTTRENYVDFLISENSLESTEEGGNHALAAKLIREKFGNTISSNFFEGLPREIGQIYAAIGELPENLQDLALVNFESGGYTENQAITALKYTQSKKRSGNFNTTLTGWFDKNATNLLNIFTDDDIAETQEKLIDIGYGDGTMEQGFQADYIVGNDSKIGNYVTTIGEFENVLRGNAPIDRKTLSTYLLHLLDSHGGNPNDTAFQRDMGAKLSHRQGENGENKVASFLMKGSKDIHSKRIADILNLGEDEVQISQRIMKYVEGFFNYFQKTKISITSKITAFNNSVTLTSLQSEIDDYKQTITTNVDLSDSEKQKLLTCFIEDAHELYEKSKSSCLPQSGELRECLKLKRKEAAGEINDENIKNFVLILTGPGGIYHGIDSITGILTEFYGNYHSAEFTNAMTAAIVEYNQNPNNIPLPEFSQEQLQIIQDAIDEVPQDENGIVVDGDFTQIEYSLEKLGGVLSEQGGVLAERSGDISDTFTGVQDTIIYGTDVSTITSVITSVASITGGECNVIGRVEADFEKTESKTSINFANTNTNEAPEIHEGVHQMVIKAKAIEFNRDLEANLDGIESLRLARETGLLYIAEEIIGSDIEPDKIRRREMAKEIQNELLDLVRANPGGIDNFRMLGELLRSRNLENISGSLQAYENTLQTIIAENNHTRAIAIAARNRELKRAAEIRREQEELERQTGEAQDAREQAHLEAKQAELLAEADEIQSSITALETIIEHDTEDIELATSESAMLQSPEVQEAAEEVIATYASETPDTKVQTQAMEDLVTARENIQESVGYQTIMSELEEQHTALTTALEDNNTDEVEEIIQAETATADTTLALSSLGLLEQSSIPKEDIDQLQEKLLVSIDDNLRSPEIASSERVAHAVDAFISENPHSKVTNHIIASYSEGIIAAQEIGHTSPALLPTEIQSYMIEIKHSNISQELIMLPNFNKSQIGTITNTELQTISSSKEAKTGFIRFYETCHSLNLVELWEFRHVIGPCLNEIHGQAFSILDGDYMGENELNIFLSSCLYATTGDTRMKHPEYLTHTMQVARELNKSSGLTTTKEVNQFGDSPIEALFRKEFAPRGNMFEFKRSTFMNALLA